MSTEGSRTAGEETAEAGKAVADRAFGEANRSRLIDQYFSVHPAPTLDDAWQHVYRLLLWIDRTTGLTHCYESDKSQPGRHWYERSLRFHDWLSQQLDVSPAELSDEIDWLFRQAVEDVATDIAIARERAAARQRQPYEGRGFPLPGQDPELEDLVVEVLEPWFSDMPSPDALRILAQRVHAYIGQENKRKNLLGEGFEDVLAAVVDRIGMPDVEAVTRPALHDVGGFYEPRQGEKPKVVDLALKRGGRRILVSAKWSVRADREEQFLTDFEAYSRLESAGQPFEYYWLTNEFDSARLVASCDKMVSNNPLFTAVVHIAPQGVLAAYGGKLRSSQRRLPELIEKGRILSLGQWLTRLAP